MLLFLLIVLPFIVAMSIMLLVAMSEYDWRRDAIVIAIVSLVSFIVLPYIVTEQIRVSVVEHCVIKQLDEDVEIVDIYRNDEHFQLAKVIDGKEIKTYRLELVEMQDSKEQEAK
ncbi:MAG: hypothetical protein WDA06_09570 [Phenylobacterium sp.]